MKHLIFIREFILDHGELIAAITAVTVMGFLMGTIIGLYLAEGLY